MDSELKLPVRYSKCTPRQRALVRQKYVTQQSGKCWYWKCNQPLTGPPSDKVQKMKVTPYLYPKGFFDNPIHLQHNHVTDLTEGAVHAKCNACLWEYEGR